ncbi:MAG: DUF1015 domain-containing protein [bacterium]|nr:DUF1015 domain-containing protein [bacterium]
MAEIRPFRGVRYNLDRIQDAGNVVAPPYDVIDGALQQALYDKHPNNVVRIIRGKDEAGDGPEKGRYTRAAEAYRGWLEDGSLTRDAEDGIYLYAQDFDAKTLSGIVRKSRLGIVTLVLAEALGEGSILPHEFTMPGPKADRLELMRYTGAAFGQIFSLYSDPESRVKALLQESLQGEPLFSFEDADGVLHRLWRVTDEKILARVSQELADKPLFIADGHHRYETAVVYRDERAKTDGANWREKPYGFRMHTLVNMDDTEGMAIYPIHRVVMDLSAEERARLEVGLADLFDVETAPLTDAPSVLQEMQKREKEVGRPVFGFCIGDVTKVRYLTLKPGVSPADLDPEKHSDAWRGLSSGLLQLVLGNVLGLDKEALITGNKVQFVKVEKEVLNLVKAGADRAGFFLNPVSMSQLRNVVLAGERMPPKSTFFYPKVYTGLVIQDMNSF